MPNSDTFEPLPIDADRLCEGISKIGYEPFAALMDITDNSVTAWAHHIRIALELHPDATLSTKGGVAVFRIVDDGKGMTDEQVKRALQIGSPADYPANSLSKFGLGLKSAGFSLGNRICVLSKHEGLLSRARILDRDVIREHGEYGTYSEDPPSRLAMHLEGLTSGTVVEVTKLLPRQDSANRIRSELVQRLGVTYYPFLSRENEPLRITLQYGKKEELVQPVDFLFLADAVTSFDPDTYDCKWPVKLVDKELDNPLDPTGPKMRLEMAIFPQLLMAGFAGFSDAERQRIKEYRIAQGNNGYFFYRNGRLILWGELLGGSQGTIELSVRASVLRTPTTSFCTWTYPSNT
jgi:Histidine kinase-, DNA gyrase B-, and HSP90-like ATPase